MMQQWVKRLLSLAVGVALAGVSTAALAQSTVNQPTPQTAYNIDQNGVDVVTGRFYFRTTDVAVGGGGDSGLAYGRYTRNSGYDDDFVTAVDTSGSTVSIGAITDTFAGGAGSAKSLRGTGATLSIAAGGNYTYTTSAGVAYAFSAEYLSQRFRLASQRVSTITWPNGKTVTLEYDVATFCFKASTCNTSDPFLYQISRVRTVTSNDGYRLLLRYKLQSSTATNLTAQQGADWMTVTSVVASNDAEGQCNPSTCPAGGSWPSIRYAYVIPAGGGLEETRTDSVGRVGVITYNAANLITSVRRDTEGAPPVALTYDSAGRVQTVTIGTAVWTYGYSDTGTAPAIIRTTTISNPTAPTRIVTSDQATLTIKSDKIGTAAEVMYDYDTMTRPLRTTFPEGNKVEYTYDNARSNLTKTTRFPKTGGGTIETSATYPSDSDCVTLTAAVCNLPTTTTDARGHVTNYDYESFGAVKSVTLPAAPDGVRPQTRYSYQALTPWFKDASGAIVASTPIQRLVRTSACATGASCAGTASETVTEIGYVAGSSSQATNLLPRSSTTRAGDASVTSTTSVTYDPVGNATAIDGPLPSPTDDVSYRIYNLNRELVGTISPLPGGTGPDGALKRRATRITRDATTGLVTRVEAGTTTDTTLATFAPLQAMASEYDPATYLKTVDRAYGTGTDPLAVTQYSYDAALRPRCTASRVALATAGDVCAQGSTPQGYDQVAETVYDGAGRVAEQRENGTATVRTTYTVNSRPATVRDANGNLSTYGYDGYDRATSITYPNGTADSVAYDAAGNVTLETRRDGGSVSNAYDALNRLTTRSPSGGNTAPVAYVYDLFGRLTSATGSGGGAWTTALAYGYDALSRLRSQDASGVGGTHTLSMLYDAAGRRTRSTWWDGFYVDYEYLVTNEVSAIREYGATSGAGVLASYTYDDLGRRRSLVRGNGVRTDWTPDGISRLVQLKDEATGARADQTVGLAYNGVSQLIQRTASNDAYAFPNYAPATQAVVPNALNQIQSLNGGTPGYDLRGNLTSDARGNAYAYNTDNQLVAKTGAATIAYDTAGRLATIIGSGTATATTRFDYDGQDMIAESDATGTLTRRYVHGPGVDEPLVWYDGAGSATRRWLGSDERGSITAITDAAGNPLVVNAYDENGVPAVRNLGRFGYTGQAWLPELGLAYYKARMYDPSLGRFLQSDPIGYAGGMNLYAYVRGDPINFRDSSGAFRCGYSGGIVETPEGTFDGRTYSCTYDYTDFIPTSNGFGGGFDYFGGGGGGGGEGDATPQKVDPPKPSTCDLVASQPGKVVVTFGSGSFVAGLGVSGAVGVFKNVSTGSGGFFYTAGGNLGLEATVGLSGGVYRSAADLRGINANINVSAAASASANFSASGQFVGASVGQGGKLGASVSISNTTFFGCNLKGK